MFIPRPAQTGDLAAIMALITHAQAYIRSFGIEQWQDGYPEPEIIQDDIARGIGYVFIDSAADVVAGYAACPAGHEPVYDTIEGAWRTSGDNYITVHRMAIDDGYRGRGLSRQMLRFAEALAEAHGCLSVRADTHRGNLAMRGLLTHCGYALCGEVRYAVNFGDPIRVAYEKCVQDGKMS